MSRPNDGTLDRREVVATLMRDPGDLLVIMTFAELTPEEAKSWKPKTATLAERNRRVVRLENPEVPVDLLTAFQR